MSCFLKAFGNIVNLDDIKNTLLKAQSEEVSDFGEDSWNWPDETKEEEKSSEAADSSWIEENLFAFSPYGDTLALASDKTLLIFTAKWDSQEEGDNKLKYMLRWQGDPRGESMERINCLLCLPMAQGRVSSSHFTPDWTCVVVGFDSGAVRFFTESGSLLLREKFHSGPVKALRCQTYLPSTEIQDELFVFYRSLVCSVTGIVLTNTLKACRNQLAKLMAKVSVDIETTNLNFTKWELTEQAIVSDTWVLGQQTPSSYDHLVSASVSGGYKAQYSPHPLTISNVIASGSRPFLALHSIREGAPAPVFTDVAKAVASKFKSAIGQAVPNWFGGRKETLVDKTKEKPLTDPEIMTCRFGLVDLHRKGENVACCPFKKLGAVSDSLGRVTLIEPSSATAIRMWKGYRYAECAFIPVMEEKNLKRRAMFFAIYAPKKGIIEVWALQNGPKVATFHVPKNGRLLYMNHGLMSVSPLSHKGTNLSQFPCIFIDPNGLMKQIVIPFHIVLSVINNKKAKDSHLLKQIKKKLNNQENDDEFLEYLKQVNSEDALYEVLEMVVKHKHTTPDLLRGVINFITEKMTNKDNSLTSLEQKCISSSNNLSKLLVIYEFFVGLKDVPPVYFCVEPTTPDNESSLSAMLRINEKETNSLMKNLKLLDEPVKAKVTFSEGKSGLPALLSCFQSTYAERTPLRIDVSSNEIHNLGELLCQGVLYGTCSIDKWKTVIDDFILPQDLLISVLLYWLSKPHCKNVQSEVQNFSVLVSTICSMADPKEITLWWPELRSIINTSENTAAALSAVYVLRSISVADEDRLFDKGDGDWVAISEESCLWTQIIAQLESIILLQSAIRYKNKDCSSPLVPRLEVSMPKLTLAKFLANGPGLVGEVVARWVGSWGLEVEWVCDSGLAPTPSPVCDSTQRMGIVSGSVESVKPARQAIASTPPEEHVISLLHDLISKFSLTLSLDNLVANLAWEYSLAWTKDKTKVQYLDYVNRAMKAISNPVLQHGLCCLMWSAHLSETYKATVRLLHKVGKVPKERLCLQDIGVSNSSVKHLISFFSTFLKLFIDSISATEGYDEDVKVPVEDLWSWTEYPPSLVQLAVTNFCSNSSLLTAKYQCANALHLLASFTVRFHHPVTELFNSVGEVILNDIQNQSKVVMLDLKNQKLIANRTGFLKTIMSAIIDQISSSAQDEELKETMEWVGRCYSLASDWDMPKEDLRIHQVSLLYLHNHDNLAEEVVSAVNEKEKLGSEMLNIAGRRMKTIFSESTRYQIKETLATMSPSLSLWIQPLEGCEFVGDLKTVKQMSTIILNLLPDSNPDYKVASLLFDALQMT